MSADERSEQGSDPGREPAQGAPGDVDVAELKQDVSRLRDDFGRLLQSGAEAARERLVMRSERMRGMLESARAGGGRALGRAQHLIEDRPLAAVLIAFGVGVLIAKVLDRR